MASVRRAWASTDFANGADEAVEAGAAASSGGNEVRTATMLAMLVASTVLGGGFLRGCCRTVRCWESRCIQPG